MSTTILEMKGRKWDESDTSSINPRVLKQQLSLTRFFGVLTFKGRAIQLTLGAGDYVCLTKKECRKLAYALLDSFDDEVYPSS